MRETGRSASDVLETAQALHREPIDTIPTGTPQVETPPARAFDAGTFAHPLVLVDPAATALAAVWSLRRHGTPIHALGAQRLEPTLWARGVRRHRLPDADKPLAWGARLLELAARLEPRPLLLPCSPTARALLRNARTTLEPHYALAHVESLDPHGYEAEDFRTENALRRTVLRGEPAFEVQVTLEQSGRCTGACVFTWVASVPPTVIVTSVEGGEILERSLTWLRARQVRGYARLIWAPDRFGRIDLQAAGTLPNASWLLAAEDGIDFPVLWYASLAGIEVAPCVSWRKLARTFSIAKPGASSDSQPLVPFRIPWSNADPLPCLVAALASLLRR